MAEIIHVKTISGNIHKCEYTKDTTITNIKEQMLEKVGIPVIQQRIVAKGKILADTTKVVEIGGIDLKTYKLQMIVQLEG